MTTPDPCIICGSQERLRYQDGIETCAHCQVRLDVDYFPESDLPESDFVAFSIALREFKRTFVEELARVTRIDRFVAWLSQRLEKR